MANDTTAQKQAYKMGSDLLRKAKTKDKPKEWFDKREAKARDKLIKQRKRLASDEQIETLKALGEHRPGYVYTERHATKLIAESKAKKTA